MSVRLHHGPGRSPHQRGNALLFALLALVVMGLTAATAMQNRRVEFKRAAGAAEASVLEKLRNAVQGAMHEHLGALQAGAPLAKGGVSITPAVEAGHQVWRPTVVQLRDMGYLPQGWTADRSALNEGSYSLSLRTIPAGCAPASCDVEAHVVVMRPVLDDGQGAVVDGVTIGPILTRTGADGGVSLATQPGMITGFNGTWTLPNPVPGQPAGVVALRVGTESGGFSQFVRVGDLRDPQLRGDLSVAGEMAVGGRSTLGGAVDISESLSVGGTTSDPCTTVSSDGNMLIGCAGSLALVSLDASGIVAAQRGISTGYADLFQSDNPREIYIRGGGMTIASPSGPLLTLEGGDMSSPGKISAQFLELTSVVEEGSSCSGEPSGSPVLAVTSGGAIAVCRGSKWIVAIRFDVPGGTCANSGLMAISHVDGAGLICRHGVYSETASLISDFVLQRTVAVQTGVGPIAIQKPNCNAAGDIGEALIIITPNNEAVPSVGLDAISGINRYATDEGNHWTVRVEIASTETPLSGNVVASIFCYFGDS